MFRVHEDLVRVWKLALMWVVIWQNVQGWIESFQFDADIPVGTASFKLFLILSLPLLCFARCVESSQR